MPRQSRIDTPGALHHIIVRGIERCRIFKDDQDRFEFVEKLGSILEETETSCYAWSLIPNHFHLLLRTGIVPIATVMRRILTGHAVRFNRRHKRHGHLFQNHYKSILCQEDTYFLELVRYIHLNPLRAKLVDNLDQLDKYPFSGHSIIMSDKVQSWQAIKELKKSHTHLKSDERILGDSDFVSEILSRSEETLKEKYKLKSLGVDLDFIAKRVAVILDMAAEDVWREGRYKSLVRARSILCYWAVRELGESMTSMARRLNLSTVAVSKSVARGADIVKKESLKLIS